MDALIAVLVMLSILVPFALAGLWTWVWTLLGCVVFVGGMEFWSWITKRGTLSQQFWRFRGRHPLAAWGLLALLAVAWAGLLVHLMWRIQ